MRGRKKVHHRRKKTLHGEEKRWKTTPLGVRILLIYISVLALFYLVFGLIIPTNIFFGYLLTGIVARVVNLAFMIVLGFMIYGFVFKRHWAGKLAMFWFGLELVNLLTSVGLGRSILEDGMSMFFVGLFILGINGFVLWYLIAKREYFLDLRYHHTTIVDKVFVLGIFLLVFFAIAATTSYGFTVYKDTIIITDKVIGELEEMTFEEAEAICSYKSDKEKDVCYMIIATAYENAPRNICDNIDYKFYKLTCVQAVIL